MAKDIRVVIMEPDPFTRNWIALLLARDWRTRIIGEIDRPAAILPALETAEGRVDLLLFEADLREGQDPLQLLPATIAAMDQPPAILLTGLQPRRQVFKALAPESFHGYVLKEEIHHSLAWAITAVMAGKWVVTPGTYHLATDLGYPLPRPLAILDGREPIQPFTEHQLQAARLALIFSMERRDMADELAISEEWGYGLVREIYRKLGLKELLQDGIDPRAYLGDHALLLSSFEKIKSEFHGPGKARDMEALAFHLLTIPQVEEIG
jgi:DNA-binding NarL/FixJ family response regulator